MRFLSARRAEAVALVALGAALWASSFAGRFQWDDFASIVGAGRLAPPPALGESLTAIRPLTRLGYAVERRLFGLEPTGYHLSSVVLHLATTLLVWRVARRLFDARDDGRSPAAFGAALLFLVHPLATEAVTYLSGRASLLAACLSLVAVERWQAWRERADATLAVHRLPWASIAAFALALLAKETAAVVPIALLLVDAASDRPRQAVRLSTRLRPYLPHLLVLALFLAAAARHPAYGRHLAHSLALRAPVENLLLLPRVASEAVTLFALPTRLNIDHDLRPEAIRAGARLAAEALALLVLAALSGAALLAAPRASPAAFGLLWFLIHLLPTASLVARNDLLSERNLYLPSVGLCLAAAALAATLVRRLEERLPGRAVRAGAAVVAGALIASLAVGTVRRNALYADPVALWRDAVAKSPAKSRPHANLGWSLDAEGEIDSAIAEYRIALRLDPDDGVTRENLVRAWEAKKRAAAEPRTGGHLTAPRRPAAD